MKVCTSSIIALAAAAAVSLTLPAVAQLTFTSRVGETATYCGAPASGPFIDHHFLTPLPTHDPISVTDNGDGSRPPSSASAQLDAAPAPSGLWIAESASAMRGSPAPSGAYAVGDVRDNWNFTLTATTCFSLTVSMSASSTESTIPVQGFNFAAFGSGSIHLTGGQTTTTLTQALTVPGSSTMNYSGTLTPGNYAISLAGRAEGNSYPYTGSFGHLLSLSVGQPVIVSTPASTAICAAGTATFTVSAAGSSGLGGGDSFSYQWQIADPSVASGWTNLNDGPVTRAGILVGFSSGTHTYRHIYQHNQTDLEFLRFRCVVTNSCGSAISDPALLRINSADFNGDGDLGTDSDIAAFFACLAGNCCPTCGSADFNGDGDLGTDADIESFFRVLSGGSC